MLIAQYVAAGSVVQFAVTAIIVAAIVGIALIAIRQSGIPIPAWAGHIFWIVLLACVAIWAIRFLAGVV